MEVRRTSFPRVEERIRPILDAFLAEVHKDTGPDYMPPKVYYQTWVAGARKLVQVLGEDASEFMPWAFVQYGKAFKGEHPHSPGSLVFLVAKWKPGRNWDSVLCDTCFQSPCVCEESET